MALQLKNMTGDLREREERLKHFYNATLDGILLYDGGKPVLINQAMLKLTGFTEEEIMRMNIGKIINFESGCGPMGIPEKPYSCETLLLKKDGSTIPVEIQFSSIEYYSKLITAAVIRDISRRVKIEKELHDERLKRLSSVIDGQEIERERLSRELHDGLGQELIAIKLKLESTVEHADEKTQKIIGDLRNEFNRTIDEIRRMSNDLMPSGLQEFGLANAIRKLCNNISDNSDITTTVEVDNFPENPDNKITMYLYRIVQEAINNSVKHAEASEICVKLSADAQFVCLTVHDNGKGFNFDNDHNFSGNGLYNMRERVNMLKGKIKINTAPGKGTEIDIQIPIN
jgi:PAS domain S-box-containing protein